MKVYSNDTRVILAGAGPGDPGLVTMKAYRAIEEAQVILYDALVNPELLGYASPDCVLIDVGKRSGNHRYSQDEINRMLLFYARRFGRVLRLKGGDPFVFGRGSEEVAFLKENGVDAVVIPGISSAIAGPAAAGIPVTQRGVSESFWVITGTLASGELSKDLRLAARSSATVVVLMGVSRLEQIMDIFGRFRSADEPVAVVYSATLPGQRIIAGTVGSIVEKTVPATVDGPGVIVIGQVASAQRAGQIMEEVQVKMKLAV